MDRLVAQPSLEKRAKETARVRVLESPGLHRAEHPAQPFDLDGIDEIGGSDKIGHDQKARPSGFDVAQAVADLDQVG